MPVSGLSKADGARNTRKAAIAACGAMPVATGGLAVLMSAAKLSGDAQHRREGRRQGIARREDKPI